MTLSVFFDSSCNQLNLFILLVIFQFYISAYFDKQFFSNFEFGFVGEVKGELIEKGALQIGIGALAFGVGGTTRKVFLN